MRENFEDTQWTEFYLPVTFRDITGHEYSQAARYRRISGSHPDNQTGHDVVTHVSLYKKSWPSGLFRHNRLLTEPDRVFRPLQGFHFYFRLELVPGDKVHEFQTERRCG